jgi:FAD:protein FMN transferase
VKPLCYVESPFFAMGTACEIKLFAPSHARGEAVIRGLVSEVGRLEKKYSRYQEDSFLSEINRRAEKGKSISVDSETASLIAYISGCYETSAGLFDVTTGALRRIWKPHSGSVLPSQEVIDQCLDSMGWACVLWEAPQLHFSKSGMELDLGGVVKEYAVDRCVALAHEAGIRHGLVNLGGDIRVIGPDPAGQGWSIRIRDPGDPQGFMRTIKLLSGALATSGDYERCLVVEGKRYGHIFNPKTGWPVDFMASVSVVADQCVVAGSVSTIGMLMGEQGISWLAGTGLPHLWVSVEGETGGDL